MWKSGHLWQHPSNFPRGQAFFTFDHFFWFSFQINIQLLQAKGGSGFMVVKINVDLVFTVFINHPLGGAILNDVFTKPSTSTTVPKGSGEAQETPAFSSTPAAPYTMPLGRFLAHSPQHFSQEQ